MSVVERLPQSVLSKVAVLGEAGCAWLSGLDALADALAYRWQLRLGRVLQGGTASLAMLALTPSGQEAVLKVFIPEADIVPSFENQLLTLRYAQGRGYTRVLDYDERNRAMLLERLGPALADTRRSSRDQLAILCQALKRSWTPAPEGTQALWGQSVFVWFPRLIQSLWAQSGQDATDRALVGRALCLLDEREKACGSVRMIVVHGDGHSGNLLLAREAPEEWRFIDPDGILCESAYDLGVLMREWPEELAVDPVGVGRERCAYLSGLTGIANEAVMAWGFVQCVSTGLLLKKIQYHQEAARLLSIAQAWLENID